LLVIDSFKALLAYADGSRELRQFIHDLAGLLTALPVTTLWVGEYGADELGSAAECAVADSIIYLHTVHTGTREMRFLQPLKMRGSTFGSGSHAYRISKSGIDVFPRLADAGSGADYRLDQTRQKSGIRQLDVMLGDGYFPGSVTLVAGPAGVGKTVMGLHFIVEGALHGEPGVIATLAENPSQLRRTAQGFGWTLEEAGVELMYRSPVDLHVDEWMYDLLATIERTKARRVMVDSLTDLRLASPEPVRFREYVYSFTHRCSRAGVSVLMTTEVSELFRIDSLSDTGVANLSENVILLQYVAEPTELRRTVTVLKTRASAHDSRIREFTITDAGIVLGGVIEPTIAQF
jgi:circadian clock protein KaiC